MSGAIYVAASGAMLQQMRMDVLANNLANVNTVGYKADTTIFRIFDPNAPTEAVRIKETDSVKQRLSPFTPPFDTITDFSAGPSKQTQNPLDLSIFGQGFFAVQTPAGVQYTRQGTFRLDQESVLVTREGYPVLGDRGSIKMVPGDVLIDETGNISVNDERIDTLKIVDFSKPYELKKSGDTLFMPQNESVRPIDAEGFSIHQGYLELSNINTIRAMTEMIESLRVFESYQKVIKSVDDINSKAVNEIAKVT
jgi:flagellar basal-body rod protein FlgG